MTVDEQFKEIGEGHIKVLSHTRDSCDKENHITITSTTDGDVVLIPGDTKYFKIKKFDGYTKSGGWYWKCGNTPEQSRIKGGSGVVKAIRKSNGVVDWYTVVSTAP
ncbi:MAG: hypothetical protein AABN95_19915 [Acidobacteriota bacterium]